MHQLGPIEPPGVLGIRHAAVSLSMLIKECVTTYLLTCQSAEVNSCEDEEARQ